MVHLCDLVLSITITTHLRKSFNTIIMGIPDGPCHGSMKPQPVLAAVANSHGTPQAESHPQTSRRGGRPVATTSTAPKARSTWCGFPDTSGSSLPGALGRILG